MAPRDSFLWRTDRETLDAVRRWARDELRSVNGQIEYVLRRALLEAGRLRSDSSPAGPDESSGDDRKTDAARRPRKG